TYDPADTQALYERKLADRRDRGVGYPSCTAIAGAGCKACTTCPHFSKGKSPLNIRPVVTATVTTPASDFADPYDEYIGPPFPFEVLNPTLRKLVDARSRSMVADPSALAMSMLTSVAGAINAESSVWLGESWAERPNIW